MKNPVLVKNFQSLSQANLVLRAQIVIKALENNPYFPATLPSWETLDLILEWYEDAIEKAVYKDRASLAAIKGSKTLMAQMLAMTATDVEAKSQGDYAKLVSSGFLLKQFNKPKRQASATDFTVTAGPGAGQIAMEIKTSPAPRSYRFECAYDAAFTEANTRSVTLTSRKFMFSGLAAGSKVYCRVIVLSSGNEEVYSPVLTRFVQ